MPDEETKTDSQNDCKHNSHVLLVVLIVVLGALGSHDFLAIRGKPDSGVLQVAILAISLIAPSILKNRNTPTTSIPGSTGDITVNTPPAETTVTP